MHPLYPVATRMVGRPVFVHHVNGSVYHGTLTSVAPHGIYVVQHPPGTRLASGLRQADDAVRLMGDSSAGSSSDPSGVELVYWPASYFAFGALTGLTLGALASPWWW
ncbi:MAG: hypothetical protein K6T78_13855 [Alicyclobacillus sp.]|nr:hypothetical protein [Alicyclobacillus sp.]